MSTRTQKRTSQALSIAAQVIQEASIHNTAVSADNICSIVINSPRARNLGEYTFPSANSWRKFLQMGHSRSLWDRIKLSLPGHTGSSETFFYYYAAFVDLETIKYGTYPSSWVRNSRGDYVMEKEDTEILRNALTGKSAQKMDRATYERKYSSRKGKY